MSGLLPTSVVLDGSSCASCSASRPGVCFARICSIIDFCCRHIGRGSSEVRVLRCRINLSIVDVGPSARAAAYPKFLADIRKRLPPGCAEASTRSTRQAIACSLTQHTWSSRTPQSRRGALGSVRNRRPWSKDVGSDVGGAGSCPASTRRAARLDRALEAATRAACSHPMSAPGARARSSLWGRRAEPVTRRQRIAEPSLRCATRS